MASSPLTSDRLRALILAAAAAPTGPVPPQMPVPGPSAPVYQPSVTPVNLGRPASVPDVSVVPNPDDSTLAPHMVLYGQPATDLQKAVRKVPTK